MGRDGGAETIEKSRGGRGRAGEEVGGTSIRCRCRKCANALPAFEGSLYFDCALRSSLSLHPSEKEKVFSASAVSQVTSYIKPKSLGGPSL